jgi:L-ascorbate metabolism protein UlaG (beta-lactamase superfamily)
MKALYKASIAGAATISIALAAYLYLLPSSTAPFEEFTSMHVNEGEVGIMFLGTSAFIIKTSHHTVVIDPATKIPKDAVASLGIVDAILITHEHSDHFDASSTFDLHHASEAVVIANEGAYKSLEGLIHRAEKLILLLPGETAKTDGIVISAIASNHSGISPLMYVISMDGLTILHGSDSGFEPGLLDYEGKIDIALLPTGGGSPTASPSQAFKMAEAVMPKIVIPMHGTSAEYAEFGSLLTSLQGIEFVEVQAQSPQVISVRS